MTTNSRKDIIIIGGGLAGLSASILCAQMGKSVLVIEKQSYPKHKVCGEYLSYESIPFLQRLGIDLEKMNLPIIKKFTLTSTQSSASCTLKTGGVGISRYLLDDLLYQKAIESGVDFFVNTRAVDIQKKDVSSFEIKTSTNEFLNCEQVIGAFGRSSGIHRISPQSGASFIGIKYHLDRGPDADTIEIHQFEGGYCGISAVEEGKYCMCYLIKADVLKNFKSDIESMERSILARNPYLNKRMQASKIVGPITTSQFYFGVNAYRDMTYPLLGDAAGFIPPITGNGMSLALRSAHSLVESTLSRSPNLEVTRWTDASSNYINDYLSFRIKKGIFLQDILLMKNETLKETIMWGFRNIPGMMPFMVKQAVGKFF